MRKRARILASASVLVIIVELSGAMLVGFATGPAASSFYQLAPSNYPSKGSGAVGMAATLPSIPGGQRIGFWVADDDLFNTGTVYGLPALPWSPQQFYNIYFNTPPYPATMLWATGLVSSGSASVPSDQEAQWLSQVAGLADSHPSIEILLLLFVNLSGNSVVTFTNYPQKPLVCPYFVAGRTGNLGQSLLKACGLSPNTTYTLALQDPSKNPVANVATVTTNSTGGFSTIQSIPNEPQNNGLWYIVVQGTPLYWQGALQSDQTQQLTSYMNILKGHSSIFGALFEPEYFGNTPAIQATFKSIVTGAGYQNLAGQTGTSDPILAYSSYPYFGGQLQTAPQANQIGVHYGETGVPLCNAQNPCPIWTQSTVLNIVDNSAPLPCTIIISSNDVNNPAGSSYLWASPTLRGWIQSDAYYQAHYLTSSSSVPTTTTTSGPTSSSSSTSPTSSTTGPITSTITTTIPAAGGIDISFSSYTSPFTYGTNFQSAGNSFKIQVPRPIEANAIAFYLSDRAYDTNPVPFTLTDPSNIVLATGTIPALLQFASQQYYPMQLSQMVTLQPGVTYQVKFSPLPAGDTYGSGSGISQDILQEAASSPGTGYLGQSQWPIFELGLMNILTQGQGLAYHNYGAYTDLFSSPGYQGTGEIAMRFQASQTEKLTSFEISVWKSDISSNQIVFALRADAGGRPSSAASNIATASLPANQMAAGTFALVNFPTSPQLSAGSYYWIVMTAPANTQDVQFGRLVNAYREYVLYSTNDFQTSWGVPPDGPTDLGFRITTTVESIVNTVSTSSSNNYFSGIAQSFIPSTSSQIKGAWVSAKPAGQNLIVSIQTDNGNDQPSGNILAQGIDPITTQFTGGTQAFVYVGFTSYASVNSGTKFWLVVTIGPCLSSSCSSPPSAATLGYRADYTSSGFGPQNGAHYELLQGSWQNPAVPGTMNFALVAPTGHEGDPIWGGHTTTITTTIQPVTSTAATTSIASTTSTLTITTTSSSTISTSTTSFLSSSSSSSSSSYTSSPITSSTFTVTTSSAAQATTTTETQVTTTTIVQISTTDTTGGSSVTTTSTASGQTTLNTLASSRTQSSPVFPSETSSQVGTTSGPSAVAPSDVEITTTNGAGISPGSGGSAILLPTTSSLALLSGSIGAIVVGLLLVGRLRTYRRR